MQIKSSYFKIGGLLWLSLTGQFGKGASSAASSHIFNFNFPSYFSEDIIIKSQQAIEKPSEKAFAEYQDYFDVEINSFDGLLPISIYFSEENKNSNEWSDGSFDGKVIKISLQPKARIEKAILTIRHELAHFFMHNLSREKQVPLWFDEGLAQLLSCRGFSRGLNCSAAVKSVNQIQFRKLSDLKNTLNPGASHAIALSFYAASFAFARKLESTHGRERLVKGLKESNDIAAYLSLSDKSF